MKKLSVILLLGVLVSACGGDKDGSDNTVKGDSSSQRASELGSYLSEDKVCDVISIETLKSLFPTDQEITTRASSIRKNLSCSYSWDRADKAEREKAMLSNIMASVKGEGEKLSMRQRALTHEITVSLSETNRTAENFIPPKLTQEQLDAQVERAQERAAERLTDEQKAVAGDMANKMMERLLKQNNQNEVVDGIGDAAYWSNAFTGSLEVLDGNIKVSITSLAADTKTEDVENAKRVAQAILGD